MSFRSGQLERGSVIGGYRIDELISRGGMGAVYRATNIALNRIYALKVLAPELSGDEQFEQRFKREMRMAASLHHPNVVGIHYAGEQDGLLFLVMDFVYGTDLRELIRKSGALEPERAVDLLAQIASALDAAHHKGLVHRDVKPANILITVQDGEEHAYLTDFGLAKRSDTVGGLTQKGVTVGTVDYMAPEQVSGGATDARTDIYALGCVFFQMLTGRVPYERENSVATLFAHVHEPPPPLEGQVYEAYPACDEVLEKAMAKAPADRYLSAGDFARDASAALRGTRYDGPPSLVATGEAKPVDESPRPPAGVAETGIEGDGDIEPTVVPGPEPRARPAAEPEDWPSTETQAPPVAEPKTAPAGAGRTVSEPVTAAAGHSGPAAESAPPAPGVADHTSGLPPVPPAGSPKEGESHPPNGGVRKYRWLALVVALLAAAGVVAVVVASSGSQKSGQPFAAAVSPVPTNHVNGTGTVSVALNGDVATVKVNTVGLLNGAPHLMHIHAGGLGVCPPASAARLHNGHLAISTGNGISFYGPPQVSLTLFGDTSAKSNLAFSRFPSTGVINYERVITVPRQVAALIREDNAVVVIHGIDYDHSGTYDEVLGRSDLSSQFTGDSTAPALCGHLAASAPVASAQTSQHAVYTASLTEVSLAQTVSTTDTPGGGFALVCHLIVSATARIGASSVGAGV